jgi:hypothetical protein
MRRASPGRTVNAVHVAVVAVVAVVVAVVPAVTRPAVKQ